MQTMTLAEHARSWRAKHGCWRTRSETLRIKRERALAESLCIALDLEEVRSRRALLGLPLEPEPEPVRAQGYRTLEALRVVGEVQIYVEAVRCADGPTRTWLTKRGLVRVRVARKPREPRVRINLFPALQPPAAPRLAAEPARPASDILAALLAAGAQGLKVSA